jgi:cysteine-rich repeat protein
MVVTCQPRPVGWLVVAFLVGTGCVDDQAVPCGDLICAPSTTCRHVGDRATPVCAAPGQLAACEGQPDGEPCRVGVAFGTCSEQMCVFADCLASAGAAGGSCATAVVDGTTCQTFGFATGELACTVGCLLDLTGCNGLCGDGFVDVGEECDDGAANAQAPDATCRLDCTPGRCGDLVVDSDEACDDGNNVYGDGCDATCVSDEACGNGVVDFALGEQCDDRANHAAHDGCSDACQAEIISWYPVGASGSDAPRFNSELVYDPITQRVLQVTGYSNGWRDTVLRWTGGAWVDEPNRERPRGRYGAAIAYDPERREVIMFGGKDSVREELGDTWCWRDGQWTELAPATSPPARGGAVFGFDPSSQQLVLFGGGPGGADASPYVYGDTWTWDGETWTELLPSTPPPPRRNAAMAMDPVHGRLLLFGGGGGDNPVELGRTPLADTWAFADGEWIALAPTTVPPARKHHAMATDPLRHELVLFGGNTIGGSGGHMADTWAWTGDDWIAKTPPASPSARAHHAMAFDASRGVVMLSGGRGAAAGPTSWTWNGTTWTEIAVAAAPAAMHYHGMAYDPRRARLVWNRRLGAGNVQTWEWDGLGWELRHVGSQPTAPLLVYDDNVGAVVLLGGDPLAMLAWTGSAWVPVPTATVPPATFRGAAGFDPRRRRLVFFGGKTLPGPAEDGRATTWEFDGVDWVDATSGVAPPGRHSATLTFDPERGALVLFGGRSGLGDNAADVLGDTWTYDGAWTELVAAVQPAARTGHTATWDPIGRRLLVFGGNGIDGQFRRDLWQLRGATWTDVELALAPSPRVRAAMVFDPVRQEVMLVGGKTTGGPSAEQWSLQFRGSAPTEACDDRDGDGDGLVGCDDPDCVGYCEPLCWSGAACPASPRCGDGTCDPLLETSARCPGDCPRLSAVCGDGVCGDDELTSACPADCARCGDLVCSAPFETPGSCADCPP